jgi:hypothetical protein
MAGEIVFSCVQLFRRFGNLEVQNFLQGTAIRTLQIEVLGCMMSDITRGLSESLLVLQWGPSTWLEMTIDR